MEKSHLIKPLLDKDYPVISYGDGIYLYDTSGKKYIDGSSGAITANLGHGVQEIIDSITNQAHKVSFVYRSQFTNEPAEQLAQKICELYGDGYWSFFVNSGSEATETAMKIAIQYWQERGLRGKNKILSRWMSYHGITIGALSMSGHPERRSRFVSILEDYPTISPPYCYRCPYGATYPGCNYLCANELEQAINRIGSSNIAAFIAEPIIGAAGGAIVPPDGYYQVIKEICVKYNILFIADEVMTGFGRTGKMFALEHWGTTADLVAIGKGMSAGYTPIAATLVSEKIIETIKNGSKSIMSGHTFSANPQSAAVALSVIHYLEKNNLVDTALVKGTYLKEKLIDLQLCYPIIGDIRGKGLMIGVEFVSDMITKFPFSKEINLTSLIISKAQQNGLLIYPASAGIEGIGGDAVLIAPPLTITNKQIDDLIQLFEQTLVDIGKDLQSDGIIST
ncbi:aspartate aminotransferase family protein [Fredinandcohnia quinoae]|uniref:Aspartate aminotransferase family protein n=1 Tax=Fredinandcohnia quinoae TaxID=2918902 RepID=A0AAW5E1Y1_9BACI|nr:aspartate aminotransferase family protein [Fredinandcohnia sp. SECRCQ15]MCH1626353.1 aspartate aminotransferase family protein [Fredinandcohnia sp. SECRCQ15]